MPLRQIYMQMPLGKLCSMVTKPYFGALVHKMERLGLEKNFSVLILIEQKKNSTQQFISDALQIDKVSMVKIIDDFTKGGLVKRTQNPADRREYFIDLTPKGKKMLPRIHKTIEQLNDKVFAGISARQRKSFYETLIQLSENMKDYPTEHVIIYKTKKPKK